MLTSSRWVQAFSQDCGGDVYKGSWVLGELRRQRATRTCEALVHYSMRLLCNNGEELIWY